MTLESALHGKEIKPVSPKGNQPWIFTGRTDAESEAPILWPPDAKKQVIGKDPDAGKDWRLEEKQARENKMVRWHHWLNRHEFEQTLGDSEGQGSLACCSPWALKESDTTEQLNNEHSTVPACYWVGQKVHSAFSVSSFFFFIFMYMLIIKIIIKHTSSHVFPQSFLSWHVSLCAHFLVSFFSLKDNCFTTLNWCLLHNNVSQL